jgi:GLPGLI family protein
MLKKILIIILCLGYNSVNSQNEIVDTSKYKAVYKLIYQRDSTDVTTKREEKMLLLIGENSSLFQSENKIYNDSIRDNLANKYKDNIQMAVNSALALRKKTRFNFEILKTFNETLVLDKIFSDKFRYKDEEKLNWKITNVTKEINSYLCQKATTYFAGRNYVAWFTYAIPISDGPYKFNGLPGLIIKIYDTKKHYDFELLSFEENKTSFSFNLKEPQKITKKDYFKAYFNFKSNFINQLGQRGISFDIENARKVKQSISKSRNNEIEIKIE